MLIRRFDLIVAGVAGFLILGLGGSLLFGENVGVIATIVGLIGGPVLRIAWPHIKERVHPFICPKCKSNESEFDRREIRFQDVPKPVNRSDIVYYNITSDFSAKTNRVEQIILKRITFEEFRKCNNCGHIQPIRTYTVDTDINFKYVSI